MNIKSRDQRPEASDEIMDAGSQKPDANIIV